FITMYWNFFPELGVQIYIYVLINLLILHTNFYNNYKILAISKIIFIYWAQEAIEQLFEIKIISSLS
ncbi:MAG: hypothetical protein ACP5DQ_02990, partial [Bacteroidales bacterium]